MKIFRQFTSNNINFKEYEFSKELALEAYLIENEEILKLDERNFSEPSIVDAEIAIKEGRRSGDGRIDLLAKYGNEYLAIIELKIGEINHNSLNQLLDYLSVKEKILNIDRKEYWSEEFEPKWIGLLVGTSICPKLQADLAENPEKNGIPIASMVIRRFRSEENDIFVISDTFFNFKYSAKDYSKFIFQGQAYNKGRLVHAVIKHYIETHPNISFFELTSKFPHEIQGSMTLGVFKPLNEANRIYDEWGHKRHFIKPEEIIELKDQKIAVCSQWNPNNIQKFIEQAKTLGLNIEVS